MEADLSPLFSLSSRPAPTFCPPQVAIVDPSASYGVQKKMLTFPPAVCAATKTEPRPLTAVWRMTEPMAVMEYWRPIGTPMTRRILARWGRNAHSSLRMCRSSIRRTR